MLLQDFKHQKPIPKYFNGKLIKLKIKNEMKYYSLQKVIVV